MKKIKKGLSLILILLVVFVSYVGTPSAALNMQAKLTNAIEAYSASSRTAVNFPVEYSRLLGEDESKREANVKQFYREDHSIEAVTYGFDVHYLVDGEWADIDNSLVLDDTDAQKSVYRNKANDFEVSFNSRFGSDSLVNISYSGYSLGWGFKDGLSKDSTDISAEVTDNRTEPVTDEERDEKLRFPDELDSQIRYADRSGELDVRYKLSGKTLKEEIVLQQAPTDAVAYSIELTMSGLTPSLQEDGSVIFSNSEGEPILEFAAPVMLDANGEGSDAIKVELESDNPAAEAVNPVYTYTITPDLTWLQSKERTYPVVIDPEVTTSTDTTNIIDTLLYSTGTIGSYTYNKLYVGHYNNQTYRSVIRFATLPALNSGDVVISSNLVLTPSNGTTGHFSNTHAILESWNESTVTYANTQSSTFSSNNVESILIKNTTKCYADLTDITKHWYAGQANNGVLLKASDESGTTYSSYYSGNATYASTRPYLSIIYINATGLDGRWSYHSQSVGRAGTGAVNDFSGNLVFTHADAEIISGYMGVSLGHVYNTNDKNVDIGHGYGWRLNYNQTVTNKTIGGVAYYEYIDGDGTRLYYKRQGSTSTYLSELDPNSTLTVGSSNITIEDKGNNKLIFDKTTASGVTSGKLTRIEDANGNYVTVSYSSNRISQVSTSDGRAISLTYSNNRLTSITVPDGRNVNYAYDSLGNLGSITYADGKVSTYHYDSNKNLDWAKNHDGYKIEYGYEATQLTTVPHRVITVTEKSMLSGTEILGQSMSFKYGWNATQYTDAQGRASISQFDNMGQVVAVRDIAGRAKYAAYSGIDRQQTSLKNISKLQSISENLLLVGAVESTVGWFSSTNTVTVSTDEAYLGQSSLYLNNSDNNGRSVYTHTAHNIRVGTQMTFSGYFKGTAPAKIQIVKWADDSVLAEWTLSPSDDYWTRESVTFTSSSNWTGIIHWKIVIPSGTSGYLYADALAAEEGNAVNRYNIVSNGDFRGENDGGSNGWRASWTLGSEEGVYEYSDPNGSVSRHPDQLNDVVYKIKGDINSQKEVTSWTEINGVAGDEYVFGGWMLAKMIPQVTYNSTPYGVGKIKLEFYQNNTLVGDPYEIEFSPDSTDWQYVCASAVATGAYNGIELNFCYNNNLNVAYFDGLQLCKEGFNSAFEYDESGNVTNLSTVLDQTNDFTYDDNNNLLSSTDAKGNETEYTYYSANEIQNNSNSHLLKSVTGATGVKQSYQYNVQGQTTQSTTGDSTDYIRTQTAYSSTHGYTTSVTDARGNSVGYEYQMAKGYLTKVTDALGGVTNYSYDTMGKNTYVDQNIDAVSSASVAYYYNNDRLAEININDRQTYGIVYDAFGRVTAYKVNNQTISANTYDGYSRLTSTTYGNAFTVYYTYDAYDRPVEVSYGDTPMYRYAYDHEGNLSSAEEVQKQNVTYFQYDMGGRCINAVQKHYTLNSGNRLYTIISGYEYEYDDNNNLSKLKCTVNGSTWETGYGYDAGNRASTTTLWNNKTITNAYDSKLGTLTSRSLALSSGTNYTTSFSYLAGANGSKTALLGTYTNKKGTTTQDSFSYTYDANGNILTISYGGTLKTTYHYDLMNRLIREDSVSNNASYGYVYDNNGNILKKTTYSYTNPATALSVSNRDGYEYVYSYSSVWIDQLTAISSYDCYGTQSLTPTVSYVSNYDGSGNPTSYLGSTLSWQGKRLTGVNSSTIYTYDENGLRTSKTVSGTTTEYYYNGSVLIGMKKGTGSTAIVQRFSYDSAGKVVAVDFSTNNGSTFTTYYYLRNGQGDIIALINDSGTKVVNYTYDTWGSQISCTGSLSSTLGLNQPFRYRGYVYDNETGWYYLRSRYYNPTVGRFISADVLMSTGQGVAGYNMYAYCLNNPVNMVDDGGHLASSVMHMETDGGVSNVEKSEYDCYTLEDWSRLIGAECFYSEAEAVRAWGNNYRNKSKNREYCTGIMKYEINGREIFYVTETWQGSQGNDFLGTRDNVITAMVHLSAKYSGKKRALLGLVPILNTGSIFYGTRNILSGQFGELVGFAHTHPESATGSYNFSDEDLLVVDTFGFDSIWMVPFDSSQPAIRYS